MKLRCIVGLHHYGPWINSTTGHFTTITDTLRRDRINHLYDSTVEVRKCRNCAYKQMRYSHK